MTWRINTRASLQGSRHEDSGWIDQDSYKPSDGYIPTRRDGWTFAQVFCATVALGLLAVSLAIGIGEVWQWNK